MKLTIVYQYYQSRSEPGHAIVRDLACYLVTRGHQVSVVCGEVGYMAPSRPTLPWYRRIVREEHIDGVRVIRTFTHGALHRSYFARTMAFASFALSCPIGLMRAGRCELVLASSPPIFAVFVASVICRLRRIPFVVEIRDLWPSSALQLGLLKNRALITVMEFMERTLYERSLKVVVMTAGIGANIRGRVSQPGKVELVTCGADLDELYPDDSAARETRERFGWNGRKIVLYFGAIGEANNIPVILRACERLRASPEVLFVIVGDGMKRGLLETSVSRGKLGNLQFLPAVPRSQARHYISAADLCLATLKDVPLFSAAIPTKLIEYMACAKPVLCGIRGEAREIIDASSGGVCFEPDDDEALVAHILRLVRDPEQARRMGENGLAYVRQRFSAAMMRQKMEAVLSAAVDAGSAHLAPTPTPARVKPPVRAALADRLLHGLWICWILVLPFAHLTGLRNSLALVCIVATFARVSLQPLRYLPGRHAALALFLWAAASVSWSAAPARSLAHLKDDLAIGLLAYAGLYSLVQVNHAAMRILSAFLVAVAVLALTSTFALLAPGSFAWLPSRYDPGIDHLMPIWYPGTGDASMFFALSIAPLVLWTSLSRRYRLAAGTGCLLVVGSILSRNRSAAIVLPLSLGCFFLIRSALLDARRRYLVVATAPVAKYMAGVCLAAALALALGELISHDRFLLAGATPPQWGHNLLNAVTGDPRPTMWREYLTLGMRHPWIGVGFGRSVPAVAYHTRDDTVLMAADPAAFAHAHNLLLDVWLQLGLVGVLLSLWLVVSLVRRCLRYARIDHSCTLIASCFLTLLFAFSLRCASDDLFIYAMSSTFWILCGVMLGLEADVAHDGQLMSRLGQLVRGPGSKVSKVIPP